MAVWQVGDTPLTQHQSVVKQEQAQVSDLLIHPGKEGDIGERKLLTANESSAILYMLDILSHLTDGFLLQQRCIWSVSCDTYYLNECIVELW